MEKKYDVFGIGNALMDFLIEVDDNTLAEMNLNKGELHLVDEDHSKKIFEKLKNYKVKTSAGGSSANTLAGVNMLGGSVVFLGKVGKDEHGDLYEQTMVDNGIKSNICRSASRTGHACCFITPDSERTFSVFLGAALELKQEDVLEEDLKQSKILHLEGYQLEEGEVRNMCLKAADIAKKNNLKVSVDLSDPGVIRRNLADLKKIVKEKADIVFVNETEAEEFTGKKDPEEALGVLGEVCDIAIVKIGDKGSLIQENGVIHFIEPFKVSAKDTTGAGDMYAAGILYGITNNIPLDKAGKIASYAAAKVVERIGARLDSSFKDEILNIVK